MMIYRYQHLCFANIRTTDKGVGQLIRLTGNFVYLLQRIK